MWNVGNSIINRIDCRLESIVISIDDMLNFGLDLRLLFVLSVIGYAQYPLYRSPV